MKVKLYYAHYKNLKVLRCTATHAHSIAPTPDPAYTTECNLNK